MFEHPDLHCLSRALVGTASRASSRKIIDKIIGNDLRFFWTQYLLRKTKINIYIYIYIYICIFISKRYIQSGGGIILLHGAPLKSKFDGSKS